MSVSSNATHVLTLDRTLQAPRANVWRCWTEPALVEKWFCPKPWFVTDVVMDVRPGGEFSSVFNGPDGQSFPTLGVFLAVEPMSRLVTTDAFKPGWVPTARAFLVTDLSFEAISPSKTRYVARARHWTAEALKEHEQMGFHAGWGKAADQLEALAQSL